MTRAASTLDVAVMLTFSGGVLFILILFFYILSHDHVMRG